jgi:hypothetical protein
MVASEPQVVASQVNEKPASKSKSKSKIGPATKAGESESKQPDSKPIDHTIKVCYTYPNLAWATAKNDRACLRYSN